MRNVLNDDMINVICGWIREFCLREEPPSHDNMITRLLLRPTVVVNH